MYRENSSAPISNRICSFCRYYWGLKVGKYADVCNMFFLRCLSWQEMSHKRNPQLVPYNQLDDQAKKLNRDTASETIRTILGFGYSLEPPTTDAQDSSFRGR